MIGGRVYQVMGTPLIVAAGAEGGYLHVLLLPAQVSCLLEHSVHQGR
jgi:hypothetical protein